MKNKLLVITALLSAGSIFCAQQQPTVLPIECSDGKLYIQESTLLKFKFFAGMAESFNCPLSEIELEPTPTKDYPLVCSVRKNPLFWKAFLKKQAFYSNTITHEFHIDCTTAVMQLLIDFIETPQELLKEQSQALQQMLLTLSLADLASLVKVADQLNLQEPYLTHLEQLLIPVFRNPAFTQEFLHDQSIQEHVNACYNLNWKHLICPRFVAASLDRTISTAYYQAFGNHTDLIRFSGLSPDGKYLATGSWDKTAKITDSVTGQTIRTINHEGRVSSVAFSPDGKYLATGSWDRTAKVTDIETGQIIRTINHEGSVCSIAFSPDGKYLATGSWDRTAKVTDIETGQTICTINDQGSVYSVALSPDGKYLAIGTWDDTAKITDIETDQTICTINHKDSVNSVAFSPDGKYLATGSVDRTVKITDIGTGQTICTINHDKLVSSVAFNPNGKYLAVNSCCIPIEQYDSTQSILIDALASRTPRLSYEQLSPKMQQLLFTLPEDLRNQLVTDIAEQSAIMHQASSDQVDDNPIPLEHRCPSGEHNTRQGCCGCGYENVD